MAWNDTYGQAFNQFRGTAAPTPFASGGGKMSAACDGAVSTYSSYKTDPTQPWGCR